MNQILQRAKANTPPFFKKLRNAGIILTAISTAILSAPFSLPAIVITVAGYAASIGLATTTVSQLTVEHKKPIRKKVERAK
ncbi:MAG: hypothetical protein EAZ13_04315 [Sphingobacteriia bacterium]|nr:MAG: hypothetical protein EAZ13_04315 [Sphingobacteriia bacterium]